MLIVPTLKRAGSLCLTALTLTILAGSSSAWASTTLRVVGNNFYGRSAKIFATYDNGFYYSTAGSTIIPSAPSKSYSTSATYFTFAADIRTRDRWVEIWFEYPKTAEFRSAACRVALNPFRKQIVVTEYFLKCTANLAPQTVPAFYINVTMGRR